MKKEELVKLGLADDVAQQIIILHGKDIETLKVAKETAETQVTTLQAQVTEANEAIESFKKLDVEGTKKAADDWKAKFEESERLGKEKVASLEFDQILKDQLKAFKVKDVADVIPHLNKEMLKVSEDKKQLIGLKEQVEPLLESKAYLFEVETNSETPPPPRFVDKTNSQSVISDKTLAAVRQGAGLPNS